MDDVDGVAQNYSLENSAVIEPRTGYCGMLEEEQNRYIAFCIRPFSHASVGTRNQKQTEKMVVRWIYGHV